MTAAAFDVTAVPSTVRTSTAPRPARRLAPLRLIGGLLAGIALGFGAAGLLAMLVFQLLDGLAKVLLRQRRPFVAVQGDTRLRSQVDSPTSSSMSGPPAM